ncbi:Uup ATPase component ABC transporter with duplicated ATPase domain protein [Pyrenophora tritici-repentis]|nr:Uup ATPase component ABC transporter with duplicated ATPase domain protein [Pyrenophora tritici-repentis]KAI0610648.1 Uup ATPase component ABC transporter with duplicated ATPase domain protein [Pyrenophora tritici-repentis]KAI0619935.1 Uup ATPase component ABC transporter with duplicated ATPase domain protein [Pyrenophora tritici-repentis]
MVRKTKDGGAAVEGHPSGGHITVTVQQSRYALDAVDAPASKEILVKDLSIAVANRELLSHSTLHLVEARHYVLVGRNGTGKSTLLKAIANGLIPGIPWSTRILLLGQTRDEHLEDDMGRLKLESETVLQHVVRSDRTRECYLREEKMLREAFADSVDSMAAVRAHRRIGHDRLALQLKECHRIAERRSGARGKQARKELVKLEERFDESGKRLEDGETEINPMELSEEIQAASDMLSGVQASLELMDAGQAEMKARMVLLGLGFKEERIDNPVSELSGGWKTRCDLACALAQYSDVLLLDEPTNFLDLPSIIWLQNYIRGLNGTTVLLTTHDRNFGDAVAEELIVLRNQTLETFRGNLSLYERERWKKAKHMTKMKEALDKQKKHVEKSIAGNIKAARDKGDDKKLKQAASRKKKLDERMGVQVSWKGGRFKLNRDLAGYHTSRRAEVEVPNFDPPVDVSFPHQPSELRFPGALVHLDQVCFAYSKNTDGPILRDVSLTIHPRARIGVAGLNGSGKSTLVSLITGGDESGGLRPTSGTIMRHGRVRIGRYSQQSVEEMTAMASANAQLTALRHVMDSAGDGMLEQEARTLLGGLGLHGQTVSDVPLAQLSGGQKVRVALAVVLWPPPHLLILDEVTTHLDADTTLGLVMGLRQYRGALVVVTHDRFFMRTMVEGESPYKLAPGVRGSSDEADESASESSDSEAVSTGGVLRSGTVFRLAQGQLVELSGGMGEYEAIAARRAAKLGAVQLQR